MTFPAQSLALARQLLAACGTRGWHLASAESCTGGLIIGCLTEIAGSSSVVERGYVNNRMTLSRRIGAGTFPPPHDLGLNTVAWTDEELAEVYARAKAGITEPNPEWLRRAQERQARLEARQASKAAAERDAKPAPQAA